MTGVGAGAAVEAVVAFPPGTLVSGTQRLIFLFHHIGLPSITRRFFSSTVGAFHFPGAGDAPLVFEDTPGPFGPFAPFASFASRAALR